MMVWHVGASGGNVANAMLRAGLKNVMVSAYSHYEKNSRMTEWKVGTIRASGGRLFIDSGMISAMGTDASWSNRQEDIAALARRTGADYVAHLDVPMEPRKLAAAHITRAEALAITIRNARAFLDADVGTAKKVFVVQGWTIDDYARCLSEYLDMGVLANGNRLGVGSCCMRPPLRGLWPILAFVRERTRGHWLHSFGTGDPDKLARLAAMGINSVDEGNTVRAIINRKPRLARLVAAYRAYDA